jgi:hypothetical protein
LLSRLPAAKEASRRRWSEEFAFLLFFSVHSLTSDLCVKIPMLLSHLHTASARHDFLR